MKLNIGIVEYPGSNCANDVKIWLKEHNIYNISHKLLEFKSKETVLDLLILPGGFAYGDRMYNKATESYVMSPGEMAMNSDVSNYIKSLAETNETYILGICNGFQILTNMGLLPGKLIENKDKKFTCKKVICKYNESFVRDIDDKEINDAVKCNQPLYIANGWGNYIVDNINDDQIFLEYVNYDNVDSCNNRKIAGITSENGKIIGMMPHPERFNGKFLKRVIEEKVINMLSSDWRKFRIDVDTLMDSEHISYKSTKKYLKKLYSSRKDIIQGPGENAGIIDIGNGYALTMRIESHNHPTFIDPYQGSATGIGGIIRDIMAMGSRPIALLDFLRFGTDEHSKNNLLPKAIKGIADYGNCVGIPNVGGSLEYNECYNKNPLVNAACIGLIKKENIVYGNALNEGSLLIYVGSKTGNDGIGGASMASNSFDKNTDFDELKKTIQKGDPFLEKLLLEACVEASGEKLIEGMQDMGAGGLLCATIEVVSRGRKKTNKNLGCIIDVDSIPNKEGTTGTDALISESQERMLLVIKECNLARIKDIFEKKWDLEISKIGVITSTGRYQLESKCSSKRKTDSSYIIYDVKMEDFDEKEDDWEENKIYMKARDVNIKDKNDMARWTEYDSVIGLRTIKGPLKEGSYSIINIHECKKELGIVWGSTIKECYDKLNTLNFDNETYAYVNCLNFGHPKDTMGDFKDCIDLINEQSRKYDIPVLGGNVSLYNCTDNYSINPTPIIVMIGLRKYRWWHKDLINDEIITE